MLLLFCFYLLLLAPTTLGRRGRTSESPADVHSFIYSFSRDFYLDHIQVETFLTITAMCKTNNQMRDDKKTQTDLKVCERGYRVIHDWIWGCKTRTRERNFCPGAVKLSWKLSGSEHIDTGVTQQRRDSGTPRWMWAYWASAKPGWSSTCSKVNIVLMGGAKPQRNVLLTCGLQRRKVTGTCTRQSERINKKAFLLGGDARRLSRWWLTSASVCCQVLKPCRFKGG